MVDPIVQGEHFTRGATKDEVNGEVEYGDWQPPMATFSSIAVSSFPRIDGYQIDPLQKDIPAESINAETPSETITVNYYKNKEYNESSSPDYWYDADNIKKPIKKEFMLGVDEGSSQRTNNNFITIHSTATPNATARDEAQFFKNNWNTSYAYTHLVVDDEECYIIGSLGYVAWGAGPTANLNSPVQIELCEFPNDKLRAQEAYVNYIHLIRQFADIYGIPKKLDRGLPKEVRTHNYWAKINHETNHTDPQTYLSSIGISFEQLRSDVEGTSTTSDDSSTSTNSEIWWSIDPNTLLPVGFTRERGTFHSYYKIKNRRSAPVLTNRSTGTIKRGQSQKYDSIIKKDGYTWIHYRVGKPSNGKYEKPASYKGETYREYYLPVREWKSNGRSIAWGWFS
nr:MAG TPA: PGRP protein [Caudoviricetes sp.]